MTQPPPRDQHVADIESDPTARVHPPRARLCAFGGLTLIPSDGPDEVPESRALMELASRRRKLALLLYLALQSKPVSRELLASLLWSEEPPERARHNLTEALSHIRRAFGRDAIAARVQDVALSPTCPIELDVRLFDAAVAEGAMEQAAAIYTGPLLSGVFLDRAPAFDDWGARERARRSTSFVALCRVLVPRLRAEGRWAEAAALGERWLDEDLEDADAATALLETVAAPGTHAALRDAIQRFQRLQTRLAAEYDSTPDARVLALSAAHEAALAALPARREADADPVAPEGPRLATPVPSAPPPAESDMAPDRAREPMAAPFRVWPLRRTPMFVGGAVALCLALWGMMSSRTATSPAPQWVLIADTQDPARDPITATSITMVLGVALAQGEHINVVTRERLRDILRLMRRPDTTFIDGTLALEMATRIGAGRVVVPSIATLGGQRVLAARTIDVISGRTLGEDQRNAVNDQALLSALDELARDLRGRLGESRRASEAVRPLPDVTTASLGALREFTTANGYWKRREYNSAVVSYQRAIALDSNFAMAHALLGQLWYYTNQPAKGDASLSRALALRGRLSTREAMRNEVLHARWRSLPDSAIAIQQRWLATFPLDHDTRSSLAYDLLKGDQPAAARDLYRSVLAIDSLNDSEWINLAAAAGSLSSDQDRALSRQAFARAFRLNPALRTDGIQNNEYGTVLIRSGFPDSAAAVFRLMVNGTPSQAARGYRSLGLLALWRNDARRGIALFDSAASISQRTGTEPLSEARARLMLASARGEVGDDAGARAELERVRVLSRQGVAEPTVLYWAGKAMARRGMNDAAREMLDTLVRRAVRGNAMHESASLLLRGELALALGQRREALPLIERGVALDPAAVPQESLAFAARAAGATAQSDSLYGMLAAALRFGTEAMIAQRSAVRELKQRGR